MYTGDGNKVGGGSTLDTAPADREAAALQMLTKGQLSQREIARRLGVADTTVLRWRRKHADQQDGGLQLLLEPV
ncbi:helix-turn-helix domain-containing protein [Rhodococcus sp. CSLK01-03]|uniref:Helix-turn-helix domain-containing protein n=1 Tax=Rhodococcus indonesiensis TaxID=3055869 RepID=A0ABT7RM38_9NOCA|nr:helix-turn-helix domain-containing protein [Rhodococcus indonesiensis]MDM7488690.1 helix-turn-helix domain-containing protein [Rhodococcus indonesiensis]